MTLLALVTAMACATAYDEDQVGETDALTDANSTSGSGGDSGSVSSTPTNQATNVIVGSATTVAESESTSDDSTNSSNTTGSGSPTSTTGASNTSNTGGGDGGTGGVASTEASATLGTGGTGGDLGGAGGNTTMGATTVGAATTGSAVTACEDPIEVEDGVTNVQLDTTGAACYFIAGAIAGWGCSNMEGRTVSVNGTTIMDCGDTLPTQMDGGYYFAFSAGNFAWAAFNWW